MRLRVTPDNNPLVVIVVVGPMLVIVMVWCVVWCVVVGVW